MGVGGQRHAPAALTPEKIRHPLYRRLGGLQGRSWRVRKILPPPVFDRRTVQPVSSPYIDDDIPAQRLLCVRKWNVGLHKIWCDPPKKTVKKALHHAIGYKILSENWRKTVSVAQHPQNVLNKTVEAIFKITKPTPEGGETLIWLQKPRQVHNPADATMFPTTHAQSHSKKKGEGMGVKANYTRRVFLTRQLLHTREAMNVYSNNDVS